MAKYRQIKPADVYVTIEQYNAVREDREKGIPHPEITSIRLTGNNFLDQFASIVETGGGIQTIGIAKRMGVKPALLSAAIEAMTGLTAHEWAKQYVHMSACEKLRHYQGDISGLAGRLGFVSQSAFSHFFYRMEHCYPSQWKGVSRHKS
jgi:AraC-like DNA-binding protein